jgi:hypothetical protein
MMRTVIKRGLNLRDVMTGTRYFFTLSRFLSSLMGVTLLLVSLSANVSVAHSHRNSTTTWEVKDLSPRVLQLALQAVESATKQGLGNQKIVGIIDFSLPSTKRRFWVLDLKQKRVLFHELVAHGKGSGGNFATSFSNQHGSFQSSLGLYLTQAPYEGEHGYSLRLQGLEQGINDQARSRAIVLHGAWYVSQSMVAQHQRLGRSLGCPAVENSVVKPLIDTLKEGNLLFAYYPDPHWLSTSKFFHPVNP